MPDENGNVSQTGWMSDVQRAIALILVGTFAILCIVTTVRLVVSGDPLTIADMTKTLQAALVNMGLIALGFFFGSNMSKILADAGQQKIVEKLTSAPPNGPVAPVPSPAAPIVVMSWWGVLTKQEQDAIVAAAPQFPRVQQFIDASKAGKSTPDDLAYLVTAGLLTQERAAIVQSS